MKKFFYKYHSILFSLFSFIGFEIIAYILSEFGTPLFIFSSILFLLLFVTEALISLSLARHFKSKMPLPYLFEDMKHIHISHHILLPLFLYIGMCGFIFFNGFSVATELIIILGVITFFSIFEGKRSSFKHEFLFDETLHYIYDSIKIMIYFLGIDLIIQSQIYFQSNLIITYALSEILAFILFLLIIVRKNQLNSLGILYIFMASLFTSTTLILLIPHLGVILIALIASVMFYLFVGLIHHKINATLTLPIVVEYILIALIILLALRGIA